MTGLTALWLPILLSAVFVFIASSIIHMAPLWHRKDYPAVPNQEGLRAAFAPLGIPPGDYMVPRAPSMAEMKTPEFQEKMNQGPVIIMTVLKPGPMGMAEPLVLWFLYCIVVGIFVALITGHALPPGTQYIRVFKFAGTTAFCCYVVALVQMSIWYKRAWSQTIKSAIDGLIYAALTAGTFGWLWPH